MTVAAIIKVTTKVAIYLYGNKMVLTATMSEYKLEVAHSAPHIFMVTTIGLVVKPSQIKVTTLSVQF